VKEAPGQADFYQGSYVVAGVYAVPGGTTTDGVYTTMCSSHSNDCDQNTFSPGRPREIKRER